MATAPVLQALRRFPPLRRRPLTLAAALVPSGELTVGDLRVLHEGAGPVVLLVGAPGAGADTFDHRPFVRAGYETVRWEARVGFVGDLADDAIAVLEALGALSAHVVGDPAVARHVALRAPDRVRSLTLVGGDASDAEGLVPPALLLAGDEDADTFAVLVARHLLRSR